MKQEIKTSNAPAAIGPYSQAIVAGDFCYVSGQLGLNPTTGEMAGNDVASQATQAFTNAKAILAEAGLTLDHAVKVTVFLTDMADFGKVNEIYAEYFSAPFPARSAFAVKGLPKGGLVEVEIIAHK